MDSGNLCCYRIDQVLELRMFVCIPQAPFGHETPSRGGNSMPKNAKDMKLNPNKDAHSSFSEDVHSNK